MDTEKHQNRGKTFFLALTFFVFSLGILVFVLEYFAGISVLDEIRKLSDNVAKQEEKSKPDQEEKRGIKEFFNEDVGQIDVEIEVEESYKGIRLISSKERPFTQNEVEIIKRVIDRMPHELYEYRPLAIISTKLELDYKSFNPEGIAYARGPYVYVGDETFTKDPSLDSGTYLGLQRVLMHEFVHVAQFFTIVEAPEEYVSSYLEQSSLTKEWIEETGWYLSNNMWKLKSGETTTDYGKTSPIEDMADSVSLILLGRGDEISESRKAWISQWFGESIEYLLEGTIPLPEDFSQRRVSVEDLKELKVPVFENVDNSILEDIIVFQADTPDFTDLNLYKSFADSLKDRGWIYRSDEDVYLFKDVFKLKIFVDDTNEYNVIILTLRTY